MITASPRYENSVWAMQGIGLVGTGFDVLPIRKATSVSDDALTRDDIVVASAGPASSHSDGPDAVGVTECNYPESCKHGYTGVCTTSLFHKPSDGLEYILLIDPKFAGLLEVVGEYVEEKF